MPPLTALSCLTGSASDMGKQTLQKRISKSFILAFVVLLTVTMGAAVWISARVCRVQTSRLCRQLVSVNLTLLNSKIQDIQRSQQNIARTGTVREAVRYYRDVQERDYRQELDYQRQLEELFYLLVKDPEVTGAYLIDRDGEYLYFYQESLKVGCNMRQQEWYRELTDSISISTCFASELHGRDYLVNDDGEPCISLVFPVQTDESYWFRADAYLVFDVSMDFILDNGKNEEMQFALLDKKNQWYTGEELDLDEEERRSLAEKAGETERQGFLDEELSDNRVAVSIGTGMFGWRLVGVRQMREIPELTTTLFLALGLALLAAVLMTLFLAGRISRGLMRPMNRLIEECSRVAHGEGNVQFTRKESREVSFLSDTIEEMVGNIVRLTQKSMEEEKLLAEEKIRSLQHQINPHFLNNVLQTIKALAVEGETDKVSKMTTLLGQMLAYSVYEPYEYVKLETELDYLKKYVELQNIRYDNRIFYRIECEEEAKNVKIPKLTLQPLAENAIEHGGAGESALLLDINAEADRNEVCILINDNGRGIGEEELEELNRRLESGEASRQKKSIGILNVNERLRRSFGREYGVEILAGLHKGTTVVVRIPRGDENEGIAGG